MGKNNGYPDLVWEKSDAKIASLKSKWEESKNDYNDMTLRTQPACKIRKDTKYCKTKQRPTTRPPQTMGAMTNWNNSRTTSLERTEAEVTWELNQFQ